MEAIEISKSIQYPIPFIEPIIKSTINSIIVVLMIIVTQVVVLVVLLQLPTMIFPHTLMLV